MEAVAKLLSAEVYGRCCHGTMKVCGRFEKTGAVIPSVACEAAGGDPKTMEHVRAHVLEDHVMVLMQCKEKQ